MADNNAIEDHNGGGANTSLPSNGPSNTGATTQWNILQRFQQQQNYLMMLYSQKMSLLPHPNSNEGLTIITVYTDNYVSPATNLMSLSDLTHATHPHVSNSTSMPPKPPNIPPIPHHTKASLLSNAPMYNAKSFDTADTTKPSSPPIQIFPEIGLLIIFDASSNNTMDHPLPSHKGQCFPSSESYKSEVTCYVNQIKY